MDLIAGDWSNTLCWLGLFFLVKTVLGLVSSLYDGWRAYILPRISGGGDFTERFGEWAVVTGCTGGIGREYALGLAKKGMNMVLVSRSKEKLEDLEKEIIKIHRVKTMLIVADFTKIEELDHIVENLRDSKISVFL